MAEAKTIEFDPRAPNRVLTEIATERFRQIIVEGFTPEHDDGYRHGALATAAAAYALEGARKETDAALRYGPPSFWPFRPADWKSKDARRDLIRAAALLCAEIERMDRNDRKN